MANRIHLIGEARQEEARAAGTITPGMLVLRGSAGTLVAHSAEAGYAERAFAIEDALQGRPISTNYTSGELVLYNLELPGNVVNALLKAGNNYLVGDQLVSAGDGTLIVLAQISSGVTVKQVIGVVETALDLSASGAVNTRTPVRIL
jgi:hypothetical protein